MASSLLLLCSGCSSSLNSVEIFKVNENGEVVNIGRMNDEGHMVYGQFRIHDKYDLAATTMTSPTGGNNSVCYIKVNDGKTSDSPGVGIRVEPCYAPFILNEGPIVSELDDFGFYYKPAEEDMGVYRLYHYNGGDDFDVLVERPVLAALWESEGFDALRKNDDDTVTLSYSQVMADGSMGVRSENVSVSAVLDGSALAVPPVEVIETPAAETGIIKKVDSETYEVSREFVEQIFNNPGLLDNNPAYGPMPKATPVYASGKISGIRLLGVEENSIYAQLGLQSGDVITGVNGQQVDDNQNIMLMVKALIDALDSGQDIVVRISRLGMEKSQTYKVK